MQILDYCEQNSSSNVVAIFSVFIPALQMTIYKVRLIKAKNGGHFIGLPTYAEYDAAGNQVMKDGKPVRKPYVDFTPERRKDFFLKVIEELKPFVRIGNE